MIKGYAAWAQKISRGEHLSATSRQSKGFLYQTNPTFNRPKSPHNEDLFLMGDFNLDYLDHKHEYVSDLKQIAPIFGLKQHIKETTRYSLNQNGLGHVKGSCLDLIFTTSPYIQQSGTLNFNLSDHLAVFITRKKDQNLNTKITLKGDLIGIISSRISKRA